MTDAPLRDMTSNELEVKIGRAQEDIARYTAELQRRETNRFNLIHTSHAENYDLPYSALLHLELSDATLTRLGTVTDFRANGSRLSAVLSHPVVGYEPHLRVTEDGQIVSIVMRFPTGEYSSSFKIRSAVL